MKKVVLFLLLCVAATAHAQIDLGSDVKLFAGAGISYQNGKFSSSSDFDEPGFMFEFGAIYKQCAEMNVDFSLAKNSVMSIDINGRTPLYGTVKLLYGAGYGFVYYDGVAYDVVTADGEVAQVTQCGSMAWPHANVGICYPINDNMEMRVVGAAGYSEKVWHAEDESSWHFTSQVRASVVWNF